MAPARIPQQESLVVYGTLRPGESNYWVIAQVPGQWRHGTVRGWTFTIGWGDAEGYPGFIPDRNGQSVAVSVLTSTELGPHWVRIDEFEGEGYRRETIEVELDDGSRIDAWIYVARTDNDDRPQPRGKTRR